MMAEMKQKKVVAIAFVCGGVGVLITPIVFWLGGMGLISTTPWIVLCPPSILMVGGPRNIEYYEVLAVIAVLNGLFYGAIGAIVSALRMDA
jgi:hypothetical protein